MKRVFFLLVCIVLSASQAFAYNASDLSSMKQDGGCDKKLADGYILGIAETMERKGSISFPEGMTYDKILDLVYWYISTNTEVAEEPASLVVENALLESYVKK